MSWIEAENDIEILRGKAALVQRENDRLHKRLAVLSALVDKLEGKDAETLQTELKLLTEQLSAQRAREFGPSSERRTKSKDDPPSQPRTGHGPTEQPVLPFEEVVHPIGAQDPCELCGGAVELWAGQTEDSEEVTVVERKFVIIRHRRQKARCKCGGCVRTAPAPAKLIVGGRYSLAFAVAIAVQKYLYHLPLARQERWMAEQGLTATRQTLWDQIDALASHLQPSYKALRLFVLAAPVVGADETTWPMLAGKKKWWAWAVGRPDAIYYVIDASRSHEAAGRALANFGGTVMCDGYSAYRTLLKARKNAGANVFVLAACWAHVRRKYVHCEADYPEAATAIELIGQLFIIEREVQSAEFADDEARSAELLRRRQTDSVAVLDELKQWRTTQRPLKKSSFGRALQYMDGIWLRLKVFVNDPLVPLTNNLLERGMRGPAIGRRNHYGSKSLRGTGVAALFYSLVETCKLVGVSPTAYLSEAAGRAIAAPGAVLLPHEYALEMGIVAPIQSEPELVSAA